MSEQGYAGILGEINTLANNSIEAYRRGDEALQAAKAGADELVELLGGAASAIDTSQAQADRDSAAILSAITHTGQAHDLHSTLAFSDNEIEANTARKQLVEAARLLGKLSRGFIHLQQQLAHGIGAEIKKHREAILHDVYGGAGLGRTAIRFEAIASQEAIISASDAYRQRRDDEKRDVDVAIELFETADTTLTPEEEATTTEEKPTPESIIAQLDTIINALAPLGPVLALFPQQLEMVKKKYDEAGSILTSWTEASDQVRATYTSIGITLEGLALPIGSESLNQHVGQIKNSKGRIETVKNEIEIAKGFIELGRKYLRITIKSWRDYLRRRT